jgi:colanic acid biosynthesis glycosyl transferase WcaI
MAERRIMCVYQHAPTPGAAGFYRHQRYFAELIRRGWHVDLVSTPVHYMTGEAPAAYRRKLFVHEEIEGIAHHWVWASGRIHASRARRAANYLSFATTSAVRGLTLPAPSIVWASSPPLFVGSVGVMLARRFRCPLLFEIRDLWPESMASVGWLSESSLLYRRLESMAHRYAARADVVIVPTQGLVDGARRHGARAVEVLSGAVLDRARDDEAARSFRESLGLTPDACVFVYTGALGVANGLDIVLAAARLLLETSGNEQIQFVLAGDGSDGKRIREKVAREQLRNVHLVGIVPHDRVWDVIAAGDVGLHCLRPNPLFEGALPTKMLEYMSARRPVITTVPGLPRELALASGGGFAPSPSALADEARRWAALPVAERRRRGELSFEAGTSRFGLSATVDRLEEILLHTIEQSSDRRRGARPAAETAPDDPDGVH